MTLILLFAYSTFKYLWTRNIMVTNNHAEAINLLIIIWQQAQQNISHVTQCNFHLRDVYVKIHEAY